MKRAKRGENQVLGNIMPRGQQDNDKSIRSQEGQTTRRGGAYKTQLKDVVQSNHQDVLLKNSAFDMTWTSRPPTEAGTYWFRRAPPSRDMMVQVREANGELTVWWPDKDQPVARLKGYWRGPIPPTKR